MGQVLDLNKFLLACFIFFIANIMAWFQTSIFKMTDWSEKTQVLMVVTLGIPISISYYYAWKFGSESLNSWWACRLLGFGISFLVFPFLTHLILHESMFKPKVLVSIFLSILIVFIQVYWPDNRG